MPQTWVDRLQQLRALQEDLLRLAEQIEPSRAAEPGVCGEWSAKELVAHLTGWELEVTRQFELFEAGLDRAIEHDVDAFNRRSVQERADLRWQETLNEFADASRRFYDKASSISHEKISGNEEFEEWVDVQIEHYRHHMDQLRAFI